jgi:hypothetical protein
MPDEDPCELMYGERIMISFTRNISMRIIMKCKKKNQVMSGSTA